MSVESEILRIQHNIANTYAAVTDKGGEVPLRPTSANLAAAVASIPVGVTQEELSQALLTKQDKLVGAPGQVVGFNAQGTAQAVPGWSNPNLLINSDFRRPVNRNGKTSYSGGGPTIDGWRSYSGAPTVTLEDNAIKFSKGDWGQEIQIDKILPGTYTMSVLASNNIFATFTFSIPVGSDKVTYTYKIPGTNLWIRFAYKWITDSHLFYFTNISDTDYVGVIAAKLEPGDHQTLAYQGDDGNWYMAALPDYDLQYALCSLYSPITGEWVGYQHSNPNLLDNWYFADPVNQRGRTEQSVDGIFIDRWNIFVKNQGSTVSLVENGLVVGPGSFLSQRMETDFSGKMLTFSLLFADRTLWAGTGVFPAKGASNTVLNNTSPFYAYFEHASNGNKSAVFRSFEGATNVLAAAKLELGPVQTLAHQDADGNWVLNDPPPNKALELAKCQRYYQPLPQYTSMIVCSTNDYEKYFDVIVAGPPMRIRGTVIHPEYIAQSKSGSIVIYSEQTWQHRVRFYSDNTLPAKGSLVEVSQNGCGISADL